MFISHVGVAFLFTSYTRLPLGCSIFFSLLPDYLYFILLYLGIEKAKFDWDLDYESYFFPYRILKPLTHTIVGGFIYSFLAVFLLSCFESILKIFKKRYSNQASKLSRFTRRFISIPKMNQYNASLCILLCMSHLFFDAFVHVHENIQLFPFSLDYPLALGLWGYGGKIFHAFVEIFFVLFTTVVYSRHTEKLSKSGQRLLGKIDWNFTLYVFFLFVLQFGAALHNPSDTKNSALLSLFVFVLIQLWGSWVDFQREEAFGISISRYLK